MKGKDSSFCIYWFGKKLSDFKLKIIYTYIGIFMDLLNTLKKP